MKPKTNVATDPSESQGFDRCYTPPYALDPLLPYIRPKWFVWESAAGEGHLVDAIAPHVRGVLGTDLHGRYATAAPRDFFRWQPDRFDAIVTNPPYSIKYLWLERCYALGRPFALLLPVETLGAAAAQRLFERYGVELLLLNKRVNFKMPNKGWGGSAQFPVFWCCWKVLPKPIVYGKLHPRNPDQLSFELAA